MTEHTDGHDFDGSQPAERSDPEQVPARTAGAPRRAAVPTQAAVDKLFPHWKVQPRITSNQPEVYWREVLSLLVLAVVSDITLFRTSGFAGPAAFLIVAPCLLVLASPFARVSVASIGVVVMTWLMAARLIWQGSEIAVAFGGLLLVAFAMTLSGRAPFFLETLGYALKSWLDALDSAGPYSRWIAKCYRRWPWLFSLHWIMPLLAVGIFSAIFVAANPNVVERVFRFWNELLATLERWLAGFPIGAGDLFFCAAVIWYAIGALRPGDWSRSFAEIFDNPWTEVEVSSKEPVRPENQTFRPEMVTFGPYRNTLIAVSVLFAAYLAFEFQTLWFKKFEKGFHFSGYAHQGAAWLTVALALATVVLSMMFRGPLLRDERLPKLKVWAWVWSIENFLLALAVYNRLWIYIGFNGMTRMRVVGILGITSVVVGFLLVVWKIARLKGFTWLLRWQMLTVVFAVYLYVVMPVDWLVYSYNVRRVLAGDPAAAVQITEHPISPEGILTLPPLLQSDNPIIRAGIHSMLERQAEADSQNPNHRPGWTSYQLVHASLSKELAKVPRPGPTPADDRTPNWDKLKAYAYQWY